MFDILDKIVSDFFNDGVLKNTKRKVKKQKTKNKTKKVKLIPKSQIYEYYDPSWLYRLYKMNQPGEYVEFEEIN